ncbi:MAG: glycine--tRNA ligase [Candidatus Sumerlaeia bacterium]
MAVTLDTLISLCKRRGLVFQSSEIYGGLAATYDYGPLGVQFKRNIRDAWWRAMVERRDDIEGIEAAILMHPRVWEVSGHVANFNDPLVDCKSCRRRFRADHIWVAKITGPEGQDWGEVGPILASSLPEAVDGAATKKFKKKGAPEGTQIDAQTVADNPGSEVARCPDCGGDLTESRQFNLMFRTFVGPVEDKGNQVYLRPETAQGIFVNYDNVQTTMRRKLPFGIAQIGKSFRNEVTTKAFIFRMLEFEQMEMEYFVTPGSDEEWYPYWQKERLNWFKGLGVNPENLRLRDHEADELAHYSKACSDVEYKFPFGWSELEGIANRTDFDLSRHEEGSGKRLKYYDQANDRHVTPYVIEPAVGVDRCFMTFLCDSYREEELEKGKRTVLGLHPDLAPIKAAVFPLLRNRDELVTKAKKLAADLREFVPTRYDDTAAIGKLYRRQDEVGTPLCVTVDMDSLEDQAVTVRHRDTMEQERVAMDQLPRFCQDKLAAMRKELNFAD